MITLSLLHPIKQIPVQVWTFPNETTIRIGRSTDNQVILYSAVVSRHHVELRRVGSGWEIVNLGTNGTYLDGKRITQVPITDGAMIRLARSGPNIQIRIGEEAIKNLPKNLESDRTLSQHPDHPILSTEITERHGDPGELIAVEPYEDGVTDIPKGIIPVPPYLQLPPDAISGIPYPERLPIKPTAAIANTSSVSHSSVPMPPCTHGRGGSLFCVECGQPLHILQTVGDYQLLKVLGRGEIGTTYQGWRAGQNLVVKTLNSDWIENPNARSALECEAELLRYLNHPQIPHLVDFFLIGNQPYLVMEMMPGQTLMHYINEEGPVSIHQAVTWILDICNVLNYLHSFTPPVLHRGIKPHSLIHQNLLRTSEAIALVDFGAIKTIALGQNNAPPGTTGYNAPEQLQIDATPAVDLYALGPLMVYLITGQNPIAFYADRDDQGYRFCADAVPGIPFPLSDVIRTLTNPKPEHRYPTATDVTKALQAIAL